MAIHIQYIFRFQDGREETFQMAFNPKNMDLIASDLQPPATWTALGFQQCEHCPLQASDTRVCPPAHHLQDAVNRLGQELSFTEVSLEVTSAERTLITQTNMASAFASMMGLIMATTGCPYTTFFKPMARMHLPLASETETAFRALATYLIGQHFSNQSEDNLNGLEAVYRDMEKVNSGFARRLQASGLLVEINSLVKLDIHAKNLSEFLKESLEDLAPLFEDYLKRQ